MKKESNLQRLPEAELQVMKILWEKGDAMTSGEVMEKLSKEKDWKLTTVLTLLSRLVERGFVGMVRQGRSNLYTPLTEKQEYLNMEAGNFLKLMQHGSLKNMIAALIESNGLDEKELDELAKWLKERGQNHV